MNSKRVALVTAGKGLGRMIVRAFAEDGYNIMIGCRGDTGELENCLIEARALGAEVEVSQADVCCDDDCQRLVDDTITRFSKLDIFVNCVGPFTRKRENFADYPIERIREIVHGNLMATMILDSLVLPHMRNAGGGRIIHFGFSRAAEAPAWPHRAVYAAAKAGLVSFTKTLAAEEAAHNITVNMVCPGEIRGSKKESSIREVLNQKDSENPGMRPGTGEDVARVVSFLCRAESDYLTGTIIDVAGGLDPIRSLTTPSSAPAT